MIKPAVKIAKEGFRVTEHTGEVENLCPVTDNHRVQGCCAFLYHYFFMDLFF